jgi:hypothetical protein
MKDKRIVAAVAAVQRYLEEEARLRRPSPAVRAPARQWRILGRLEQMRRRSTMFSRPAHGR